MDPAEIRRINFIRPDQFPFTTPTEPTTTAALRKGARRGVEHRDTPTSAPNRPAACQRDAMQLGIGLSTYWRVTAPAACTSRFGAVEIHDDGSASVVAGTSSHGQGHHTTFAMLASEILGIPMDKINLSEFRHRTCASR